MRCSIGQRRLAGSLDQPCNVVEGNLAGEKGLDRDLVRGVHDCRRAIARAQSVERHPERRETAKIGPLERQLPDRSEIEPACAGRQPPRIGQAMRDRHAHIGKGEIGLAVFRFIMNEPRFRKIPKVLETPKGKEMKEDVVNLRTLRKLITPSS